MRWITLLALGASLVAMGHGAEGAPDTTAPAADAAAAEPQLEGVVVERTGGGYLTLMMDGTALVIRFFDTEKKPVPPDVSRGFVRFQFPNRSPERRPLNPTEDGLALRHGQPLRHPHVFKAFLTLVHGEGEDDVETYTVDYP